MKSRQAVIVSLALVLLPLGCGRGSGGKASTDSPDGSALDAALIRWRAIDARAVGSFWRCLFGSDVEMGAMGNAQQIRRLVERAYDGAPDGQKQAFVDRARAACLPELAAARRDVAHGTGSDVAAYAAALERLEVATRGYLQRMRTWQQGEETDEEIAEHAGQWHRSGAATRETVAYDRFLRCAVPNLDALPDGQAVYEHLSNTCFRGDPVAFTDRIKRACAPLLQEDVVRSARATRAYVATRRRLRDPEGRQQQAWASCLELAQEQRMLRDAGGFMEAAERYLAARPR